MNDETRKWVKAQKSKNYPYCGLCYTRFWDANELGKWGHCPKCEIKRIEYESSFSSQKSKEIIL